MIPCSQILFFKWLQGFLLPCPFKHFTGIDCPGCGFQRAILALLQGHLHQSLTLYPAAIPLLIALAYTSLEKRLKLDAGRASRIKRSIYVVTAAILLASYALKMFRLYKVSV